MAKAIAGHSISHESRDGDASWRSGGLDGDGGGSGPKYRVQCKRKCTRWVASVPHHWRLVGLRSSFTGSSVGDLKYTVPVTPPACSPDSWRFTHNMQEPDARHPRLQSVPPHGLTSRQLPSPGRGSESELHGLPPSPPHGPIVHHPHAAGTTRDMTAASTC